MQQSPSRATFVVTDDFGALVAERCGAGTDALLTPDALLAPDALHRPDALDGSEWTSADARRTPVVLAGTGRDDDLREALDAHGAAHDVPTVGLELLPTRIVCGPAVIPGRTACHRCWRTRVAQHTTGAPDFGEAVSSRGLPAGFARFHVALAAGLLALALDELRTGPTGLGGTVRSLSLVTGRVSAAHTVAVDRCPRCGPRFADVRGHDRFVRELEGTAS